MTVFNDQKINEKQYMFFGETLGLSRYDDMKYPIFYKLIERQKEYSWGPDEVDLNKDNKDFKLLNDAQKHIFTKTLSYQTMLDSIQGRSPALALLPHCSAPELESCITWWCAFEQIHNQSYSHIVRNVYPNPSEIFDNIVIDEKIMERARKTIYYYDDFIKESEFLRGKLASKEYGDKLLKSVLRKLKKKLLLCVASINALEGLSFYASFACSFAFAEQGLMEGNAKIITLIARDEALHLAITQNILKKWKDGEDDPEMKELYEECLPKIEDIYLNMIEQEKIWCDYLFKDGSMLGLNTKILTSYVEYMAGKRMKNLGIKHEFSTKNPLPWTDKYLKGEDNQVAPMETEITSYIIGGVKNDIEQSDFKEFSF